MSRIHSRFAIRPINVVVIAVFGVSAVTVLIGGQLFTGLYLAVATVYLYGAMLYARRGDSSEVQRVNALEYRDERDRMIARNGFSVVGAAALALAAVQILVASVWVHEIVLLAAAWLLALCIVWGVANSVSARRG
ncbi:hypothetical protein GCM10025867_05240 [Frondihabitans sucicola]|uniref:DUF2178 domain-containing protein n=1 Tax=Frondihabitans sucicola TaxID=1268041 RepID=A0ABN6XTL8_9MICO|nr:hypothetical protein [Frondihabitans sucicola]BDZ48283.1 hypothetical protein GCM10025867_05240 [Frondihabitans sucicola]